MKCVTSVINSQMFAEKHQRFFAAYWKVVTLKTTLNKLLRSCARTVVTVTIILAALLATPYTSLAGDNVLSFNGSSCRVTTAGRIITGDFTVEAWFKISEHTYQNVIFSQYAGTSAGRFIVGTRTKPAGMLLGGGGWHLGTETIPLNTWTHIAVTRMGSLGTVYINGSLYKSDTINTTALPDVGFIIGNMGSTGGSGCEGDISDVRIWNVVRTQEQISNAKEERLTGTEIGLVHYWPMNEGSGSTVEDACASGDGTIIGATWTFSSDLPFAASLPESIWTATTGGDWSSPANWLNASVPNEAGSAAIFTNQSPAAISVTNDISGLSLGQIRINGASSHIFTGNDITLTSTTASSLISSKGSHTFDLSLATTASGLNISTFTPASLTFMDVISGPGNMAINPTTSGGTVTFDAANTYSGGITLGSGTFITDTLANGGVASPLGASSADAANLKLGPGTLRYTGGTASTDRGYTVDAGSDYAAILDTDSDITFSGQITATSGAFIKTGIGTVSYTYPGLNTYVANGGNPNALMNIGDNGDSPTTGFSGLTILEGKLAFGVAEQTNFFGKRIDIGMFSTTNAGEETSGELEINNGTFICTDTLSIGRHNGNTNTAPEGTSSKLVINGGECYLALVAAGNNALGLPGFNPRSIFEINGGYVELSRRCGMGQSRGSHCFLNVNGGHLKVTKDDASIILGGDTGEGTLTMTGDAIVEAAGYVVMASGKSGDNKNKGTCNLNGGTLIAGDIRKGLGVSGILNFNGGIFKPHTAGEALNDLTSANVSTNGAVIDSSLASYTIAQNLLHDAKLGGSQDGGLIKLGGNTLTIACTAPTYTGPTVVSNGTLRVTGALPTGNALTISSGANLSLGINGSKTLGLGNLTLLGNGRLTLGFLNDGSSNDQLAIASSPILGSGQIALIRSDNSMPCTLNGSYTIMTYIGADPDISGITLANPVFGKIYTFAAANGSVTLSIATDTTGASAWNVNAGGPWATDSNWSVVPANVAGAQVRFDDAITGAATVTSAGETVGEIYFNNIARYTIGGTGLIIDNSPLNGSIVIETGSHAITAPLVLSDDTSVSLPGGTHLNLGAISGGSNTLKAEGDGSLTLTTAPTVQKFALDISTLSLSTAMTLTTAVELQRTLYFSPALNTTAIVSGIVSGSGGLTKSGSSILQTTAENTYSGPTTVSAGTLRIATLADGGIASPIGASSAASSNLLLGEGTLHITASDVSVNRGYTIATSANRAAILRNESNITFSGQINATYGGFIKTGPGTVTYTYPGKNILANASGSNPWAQQDTGVNGDSPISGWSGLSINQGALILGVSGQTNRITSGRMLIGLCTTAEANAETAGELILNDGALLVGESTIGVGCNNGTTVTAGPNGLQSKLTVNGGYLSSGYLTLGGNQAGLAGFNARPLLLQTGGLIESTAYFKLAEGGGSISRANLSGGTFNVMASVIVGQRGEGILTLSGDAALNATYDILVASEAGSQGTINLNGGTLTAKKIKMGVGSSSMINFNGGIFKPHTAGGSLTGLTAAYVSTNGAVIDTSLVGHTIAQPLLTDPMLAGTQDGGLRKLGGNTLTLDATGNTFNGLINVTDGTLQALLSATNDLSVAKDAIFDASGERAEINDLSGEGLLANGVIALNGVLDAGSNGAPAGAMITVENLSMAAGSTFVCDWSTNAVGEVTNDFVAVTGTLASGGRGFIDFNRNSSDPITVPFEVTIMAYNNISGSFTGWKSINTGLPDGQAIATIITASNNEVTVKIRYGGTLMLLR